MSVIFYKQDNNRDSKTEIGREGAGKRDGGSEKVWRERWRGRKERVSGEGV